MKPDIDLGFVERALDNGLDGVAAYCDDLRVCYWNRAMEALCGVPRTRAMGTSLYTLFPGAREGRVGRVLRGALDGRQTCEEPPFFGARDPAEAQRHEWFTMPLWCKTSVRGAVVIARSRAARQDLENRLAETEQRFRAMADSSPVLLWMADPDALCSFFNSSWLEFSGRTMKDELGMGWAEGVHPEDFEGCMNTYLDAFVARRPLEMEYRLRRHDGAYRWILDRGNPRFGPGGEFLGYIGSCVDITDRRDAEERTRQLAAELERANAHMERLLYAASHDLNEPIRMVSTFVGQLERRLEGTLDDRTRGYVRFATEGAERMRRIVDGLLEFARTRNQVPRTDVVDMNRVMRAVLDELALTIEDRGARVDVESLSPVVGDENQLRRLFSNLVSNALKFCEDRPEVRVSQERSADRWVFCVADNGIGFEPEYAEKAFGMFQRLHTRERFPGSGIGLALVKEIAESHQGRVWATATPGRGARFHVALRAVENLHGEEQPT